MNDQPWLIEPDPEELDRIPFDPATRTEGLEAGCTQADLAALERLREPARSECLKYVMRFRRSPHELPLVEKEATDFLAKLKAAGISDPVSYMDLCGALKLLKARMDHDQKRFYCWVLKRRGGPLAERLAVDSEEFRALANTGWKEEAHE